METSESILRLPQVRKMTGLGRSSIYASIKNKTFPAPIKIGPRASGWLATEIVRWINERVQRRSDEKIQGS